MDDIETTIVALTVGDDTNTTHVATTGDHGDSSSVEADEVGDLSGLDVNLDGVVDLDGGVGVTDGAGIVGDEVWDTLGAKLDTLDLAELVAGLGLRDAVDGEAPLGVVDEAEVLAGLLDGDDVHESSGVGGVSADLSVDLDQALHDDGLDLPIYPRFPRLIISTYHRLEEGVRYLAFNAYLSLLRIKTTSGKQSLSL